MTILCVKVLPIAFFQMIYNYNVKKSAEIQTISTGYIALWYSAIFLTSRI
jgi:hypothetical protein